MSQVRWDLVSFMFSRQKLGSLNDHICAVAKRNSMLINRKSLSAQQIANNNVIRVLLFCSETWKKTKKTTGDHLERGNEYEQRKHTNKLSEGRPKPKQRKHTNKLSEGRPKPKQRKHTNKLSEGRPKPKQRKHTNKLSEGRPKPKQRKHTNKLSEGRPKPKQRKHTNKLSEGRPKPKQRKHTNKLSEGRPKPKQLRHKTLKEWLKIEMEGVDCSLRCVSDDTGGK